MTALRCKPGDLAVIVRADTMPMLLGRFVTVIRLAHDDEFFRGNGHGAVWWCSAASGAIECKDKAGRLHLVDERPIYDDCLRPIRPNEGEDETLSYSRSRVEEMAW